MPDGMLARGYSLAVRWGWALLLLLLPLTSLPLAARILGSQMVSPASALVLLLLVMGWFLPYLLLRGVLSWQTRPLIGLALIALVSVLLALLQPAPAFRYISQFHTNIEALLTLAVGVCFYLVAATWARDRDDLSYSLRWLNWGGFLLVAWSLLQAVYWYQQNGYPDWLVMIQGWLSSGKLFPDRIVGTTYEPSWLAHVLNLAYLPFWLASTLRGYTAHRFRLWKFSLENFLLVGGLISMVLSKSRVGMLAFLLMVALLGLFLNIRLIRWIESRLTGSSARSWLTSKAGRVFLRASLPLALVLLYLFLAVGTGVGLSRFDPRLKKLFDFAPLIQQGPLYYANQLVFAERVVFWEAGWSIFNDHPLWGVGLGNAGYYFPQKLSAFSMGLTEVRRAMYEWTSLPNIKSLWMRLLAETGIFGFAFFVSWLYALWHSARFLRSDEANRLFYTLGMAGAFTIVALLAEGFSVDTFALPYFWVSFGLVTAASEVARCGSLKEGAVE